MLGRRRENKARTDEKKKKWKIELEAEGSSTSTLDTSPIISSANIDNEEIESAEDTTGPVDVEASQLESDDKFKTDDDGTEPATQAENEQSTEHEQPAKAVEPRLGSRKRKRLPWMDSDDESISCSSSDEQSEKGLQNSSVTVDDSGNTDSSKHSVKENRSPLLCVAASDIVTIESSEKTVLSPSVSAEEDVGDKRSDCSEIAGRKPVNDSVANVEVKDDILSLVRFALVSNLTFAATREELLRWFSSKLESKTSVLKVINDPQTSPTISSSSHGSSTATQRTDHNGRAYVEFSSNQVRYVSISDSTD